MGCVGNSKVFEGDGEVSGRNGETFEDNGGVFAESVDSVLITAGGLNL